MDSVRAYALYLERAGTASWHFHPWDYYLRLLVHFPATGTPFWTEGLIVVLAVVGGRRRAGPRGACPARTRGPCASWGSTRSSCSSLYSAIPYKTPWCLLGFLHGMILLAGAGAVFLVQAARGVAAKALVCALLVARRVAPRLAGLLRELPLRVPTPATRTSTRTPGRTSSRSSRRLKALAEAHPDGLAMPVQVVSRENLWPLPWYLRGFSNVAWWNGVSDTAPSAPVIVATPDMEEALVPGSSTTCRPPASGSSTWSIFERPVELRPRVELRGYAARTLVEAEAASQRGRPGMTGALDGGPSFGLDGPPSRARGPPLLPRGDGDGVRGPLRPRRRAIRRRRRRRPPSSSWTGSSSC